MRNVFFGLFGIVTQGFVYFIILASGIRESMTEKETAYFDFMLYAVIVVSLLAATLLILGYVFDWKYIYSFIFLPLIVFVPLFLYSFL